MDMSKRPNNDFTIYSPLNNSPHAAHSPSDPAASGPAAELNEQTPFTSDDLLKVMQRLTSPGVHCLPYFPLCRELGAAAVDGMVKGRILELRWTPSVTPENPEHEHAKEDGEEARQKFVGPVLSPTTPILGYAMRIVLKEWDDQSS